MAKYYKKELDKGSWVCDMHDGFPDDIEVIEHIKIRTKNASEMVEALVDDIEALITNKIAYVVDIVPSYVVRSGMGETVIQAVYSMNGNVFGVFHFVDKTKKPWN